MLQMIKGRKADYRLCLVYGNNGKAEKGIFHCWGYNNMTVAVVESEDGTVRTVFPWKIRFIDSDKIFSEYAWDTYGSEYDEYQID